MPDWHWISDCGRARARQLRGQIEVQLHGEHYFCEARHPGLAERPRRLLWIRIRRHGNEVTEAVVAAKDGDELVLAHVVCRLLASGGPDDPRTSEAEYRCAPVLEVA